MEIKEQDILKTIHNSDERTHLASTDVESAMPPVVRETLAASDENRAGVSVKVTIGYESLTGNLKNRDFLIRRVIQNGKNYFLDGVALDINAPRLIKVSQISNIKEFHSGQVYGNPYQFLQNVLGVEVDDSLLPDKMTDFAKAVKETGYEITVLMYLVAIDGVRSASERQKVLAYVRRRVPYLNYDESEMNDYLISLAPDEDSFSMALHRVLKKGIIVVQPLMEAILDIIMADGQIHVKERAFLARLIDLLKQAGYEFKLPTDEK